MIFKKGAIMLKIIAHRGASSYAPENTLPAFEKAIKQKADAIELDVRLSKDNVPVIIHDATINRTSNGKGYVHNLTVKELKKYDYGCKFSNKFKGVTIPTLEEVLQLLQNHPINLHIELKNGPIIPKELEQKVLELIYHYDFENRVIYSSFDHISLQRLSFLDPQAKIGLLFHINLINLFQYVDQTGLKIHSIHPNHFYVTEEMIMEARKRNIDVNIYTVNNKKMAHSYKKMGVNGLITNDPLIFK